MATGQGHAWAGRATNLKRVKLMYGDTHICVCLTYRTTAVSSGMLFGGVSYRADGKPAWVRVRGYACVRACTRGSVR